jgi:uncharacterized protein (UPF0332 family)
MNWRDFVAIAAQFAAGPTEAEWRSAVSRAYYAAFHVARSLLSDLRFVVPRADRAHQYLVFRLCNSGEASVEQAGRNLETLRRLRNRADYDDAPPVTKAQAGAAVQLSKDIISVLDSAQSQPIRSQITNAMAVYERDVLKDVTWQP